MTRELIVTQEIAAAPIRRDDAHKGDVGRVAIVGGCAGEVMMVGAPSLAAAAALRGGAGLVQLFVPDRIREAVAVITPCATVRRLAADAATIRADLAAFGADVLAIGPGLGDTLAPDEVVDLIEEFPGPVVADADALNALAKIPEEVAFDRDRVVLTPHPGEARRLLGARANDRSIESTAPSRRAAACAIVEAFSSTVVLKGRGTVVTNGERIYTNQTGNAGMATAGTGDVLTGLIAALIGQKMPAFEASILGVYLHGLAGDFAAEELGRVSLTALDLIDYLPEAFAEHESAGD